MCWSSGKCYQVAGVLKLEPYLALAFVLVSVLFIFYTFSEEIYLYSFNEVV